MTTNELYNKLLETPEYISELKPFELTEVKRFAEAVRSDALGWINAAIIANPNYSYPAEYLPDKQVLYWCERHNRYKDAQYVLSVIATRHKRKSKIFNEIFEISGIDIDALVDSLLRKGIIDVSHKNTLLAWFRGTMPEKPIPINESATRLISIIADLMDARPKHINNSKEFIYYYIGESFLFNGRKLELNSIKQLMKPGNYYRTSHKSKTIPDINSFRI